MNSHSQTTTRTNTNNNNNTSEMLASPEKHHRKTMSYNDVQIYHRTATNRHHLASYGAFKHQQHQMQQQQQQPQSMPSYPAQPYVHGKRASLAAFDPLAGSSYNSSTPLSPMGRDSSPTSPDASHQERQPVTPPSTGRPVATTTSLEYNPKTSYQTPTSTRNLVERFDNEKTSKNPMAKTVKFLRKLGQQHSPNNSGHKRTRDVNSNNTNNNNTNSNNNGASSPGTPAKAGVPTSISVPPAVRVSSSLPQEAGGTHRDSTTSMAQDLLELSDQFGNLQLPSLQTKNAPTSFLTGTTNEAVTTSAANDPTPFQLEIPSLKEVVTMARLNEFVENYRRHDQNLDLKQFVGLSRLELQQRINSSIQTNNKTNTNNSSMMMVQEHVPIVQSLLDCSEDELSIQGFLTEGGNLHSDSRVEAVIFQGQKDFTVVFRGTTEQQSKVLGNSKSKKRGVPLDSNNTSSVDTSVEVYSGFLESYSKVEEDCFRLMDKLVDENPFCDFVFSGFSYGAALATLAATRYARARPMMRVGCLTLASPKVGFDRFQHVVHTTPNLRVVRLELGGQTETKCQGPTVNGCHVGHTLVLNSSSNNSNSSNGNSSNHTSPSSRSSSPTNSRGVSPASSFESNSSKKQPSVSVYKFESPKHKNGGFFKTSNPGLKKYISTLEDLAALQSSSVTCSPWPKDFCNNAGEGVVVNNEKRLVV